VWILLHVACVQPGVQWTNHTEQLTCFARAVDVDTCEYLTKLVAVASPSLQSGTLLAWWGDRGGPTGQMRCMRRRVAGHYVNFKNYRDLKLRRFADLLGQLALWAVGRPCSRSCRVVS